MIVEPWEKRVIIKMLGRQIGFRALERRLQLIWAKRGVLNIINHGQDFYLVTFTNEEDHALAFLEDLMITTSRFVNEAPILAI